MKHLILGSLILWSLTACSNQLSSEFEELEGMLEGDIEIALSVGEVGVLSKRSVMNLKYLIIKLSASGEKIILDTTEIKGLSSQKISKKYLDLASLKNWTVEAWTIDEIGTVIHNAATNFYVQPEEETKVNLDMNSMYAVLQAKILSIPDSVQKIELIVDEKVVDAEDLENNFFAGEDQDLLFNYLTVNKEHKIVFNSYGSMWGKKYLLYTGSTEIFLEPGKSKNYTVTMNWVGPDAPPKGAAFIEVTIGTVGKTEIKGEYKKHRIKYEAEEEKDG